MLMKNHGLMNLSFFGVFPHGTGGITLFLALALLGLALKAPAQVALWLADGNAQDFIGTHHGYLRNGVAFAPGRRLQAFSFDGIDDYVDNVPFTDTRDNFTIAFWAFPADSRLATTESLDSTGTAGQRYAIFPFLDSSTSAGVGVSVGTNGISVFEHAAGYMPSLLVYDGAVNQWTHIVVVYTNKQPSLYVNGSLVRTGLTSSRISVYPSTTLGGDWELGYYGPYRGCLTK